MSFNKRDWQPSTLPPGDRCLEWESGAQTVPSPRDLGVFELDTAQRSVSERARRRWGSDGFFWINRTHCHQSGPSLSAEHIFFCFFFEKGSLKPRRVSPECKRLAGQLVVYHPASWGQVPSLAGWRPLTLPGAYTGSTALPPPASGPPSPRSQSQLSRPSVRLSVVSRLVPRRLQDPPPALTRLLRTSPPNLFAAGN